MGLSSAGLEITISLIDIKETDEEWIAVVKIKKTLTDGGFELSPPIATIEVLKFNEEVLV